MIPIKTSSKKAWDQLTTLCPEKSSGYPLYDIHPKNVSKTWDQLYQIQLTHHCGFAEKNLGLQGMMLAALRSPCAKPQWHRGLLRWKFKSYNIGPCKNTVAKIPSLKLTARTWKWMVGILYSFLFGARPIFRGEPLVLGRVFLIFPATSYHRTPPTFGWILPTRNVAAGTSPSLQFRSAENKWKFSKNRGGKTPPNHPILIGFSIIFTIHFGVPLFFGNIQIRLNNAANTKPNYLQNIKGGYRRQ